MDLNGKLRVPDKVMETEMRLDMLLIFDSSKRKGLIELTAPSADRVEVAGEFRKRTRRQRRSRGCKYWQWRWDAEDSQQNPWLHS